MNEEDKKLQKHLVDEMMKVSESNPDVMFYMETLMKKYEELEQKVEQLENIRKETIEYIKAHKDERNYYHPDNTFLGMKVFVSGYYDLLNILNKGSDKE